MAVIVLHTGRGDFPVVDPLREVLLQYAAAHESPRGAASDLVAVSTDESAWRGDDDLREMGALRVVGDGEDRAEVLGAAIRDVRRENMLEAGGGDDRPLLALVPVLAARKPPVAEIRAINDWLREVAGFIEAYESRETPYLAGAEAIRSIPWLFVEKPDRRWPGALFSTTPRLTRSERTPIVHVAQTRRGATQGWPSMREQLETELHALAALSQRRGSFDRTLRVSGRGEDETPRMLDVHSGRIEIPLRARVRCAVLRTLGAGDRDSGETVVLPDPGGLDSLASEGRDALGDARHFIERFERRTDRETLDADKYRFPDGPECPVAGLESEFRSVGPSWSEPGSRWPGLFREEWPIVAPPVETPRLLEETTDALRGAYEELLPEWTAEELERVHELFWGTPEGDEQAGVDAIEQGLRSAFEGAETVREGVKRQLGFVAELGEMLAEERSVSDAGGSGSEGEFDIRAHLPKNWPDEEIALIEQGRGVPSKGAVVLEILAFAIPSVAVAFLLAATLVGPAIAIGVGLSLAALVWWVRRRQIRRHLGAGAAGAAGVENWESARQRWIESTNEGIEAMVREIDRKCEVARAGASSDVRARLRTVDRRIRTEVRGLAHMISRQHRLLADRLDELVADESEQYEQTGYFPVDVERPTISLRPAEFRRRLLEEWRPVLQIAELPVPVDVSAYAQLIEDQVQRALDRGPTVAPSSEERVRRDVERFVSFVADEDFLSDLARGPQGASPRAQIVFGGDPELARWDADPESLEALAERETPQFDADQIRSTPSEEGREKLPDVAWGLLIQSVPLAEADLDDE